MQYSDNEAVASEFYETDVCSVDLVGGPFSGSCIDIPSRAVVDNGAFFIGFPDDDGATVISLNDDGNSPRYVRLNVRVLVHESIAELV